MPWPTVTHFWQFFITGAPGHQPHRDSFGMLKQNILCPVYCSTTVKMQASCKVLENFNIKLEESIMMEGLRRQTVKQMGTIIHTKATQIKFHGSPAILF